MSFNIFRKSTKSEAGSKNASGNGSRSGTPTGSEVLTPSSSAQLDFVKVKKSFEQEKLHNVLSAQQMEALRENIRHMEYEANKTADSKIYQNLKTLIIEIIKMLPIM